MFSRYWIGNVEVLPLLDAETTVTPQMVLPDHADAFLAELGRNPGDDDCPLQFNFMCYLLRSAGRTILIDTGTGPRPGRRYPIGRLDHTLGELGLAPTDVDLVVHTHLHGDHIGWNTVDDEHGVPHAFFSRARYVVHEPEWDHWIRPEFLETERRRYLRECVTPVGEQGHVDLVSADTPIDRHVSMVPTPGHTPGHVAVRIVSRGEHGLIFGDCSHHTIQLTHPEWSPDVDTDPGAAATTRGQLFEEAADGPVVFTSHWDPPVGHIVRIDGGLSFVPLRPS
jgi:glyoxylase-like metal-dependent hydrolase (beta-lactamase superfamily II)